MSLNFCTASPTLFCKRTVSALSSSHCSWSMRRCRFSISFCLESSSLKRLAMAVATCKAAEITARITDAFSMVDIEAAPAAAAAVAPCAVASTVASTPSATPLPTSPMASMTVDAASNTASIVSRALPIPFATSSENIAARFCAWPPIPEITPPTARSCVAKFL